MPFSSGRALPAFLAGLVGVVGCYQGGSLLGARCEDDAACQSPTLVCGSEGLCVPGDPGSGTDTGGESSSTGTPGCSVDEDCNPGEVCNDEANCIQDPATTTGPTQCDALANGGNGMCGQLCVSYVLCGFDPTPVGEFCAQMEQANVCAAEFAAWIDCLSSDLCVELPPALNGLGACGQPAHDYSRCVLDTECAGVPGECEALCSNLQLCPMSYDLMAPAVANCAGMKLSSAERCDGGVGLDYPQCLSQLQCEVVEDATQVGAACVAEANAMGPACRPFRCGDGIVVEGIEDCDDGNRVDGDACPTDCRLG